MIAETDFFAETVPDFEPESRQSVIVYPKRETPDIPLDLYHSCVSAIFDMYRLRDAANEVCLVVKDGKAAGFNLFVCKCGRFVTNSLLLLYLHHMEACQYMEYGDAMSHGYLCHVVDRRHFDL